MPTLLSTAPFTLIHRDGRRFGPFDTLLALAYEQLQHRNRHHVGLRHREVIAAYGPGWSWDPIVLGCATWVVVDRDGIAVAPSMVLAAQSIADTACRVRRAKGLKTPPFRSGPIPFTGKVGGGGWYRYPKTSNEIRSAAAHASEGVPSGRARRHNLPTVRDDIGRCTERNWKSQRKTRWKTPQA